MLLLYCVYFLFLFQCFLWLFETFFIYCLLFFSYFRIFLTLNIKRVITIILAQYKIRSEPLFFLLSHLHFVLPFAHSVPFEVVEQLVELFVFVKGILGRRRLQRRLLSVHLKTQRTLSAAHRTHLFHVKFMMRRLELWGLFPQKRMVGHLSSRQSFGWIPLQTLTDEAEGVAGTLGNHSRQRQLRILRNSNAFLLCLFCSLRPSDSRWA